MLQFYDVIYITCNATNVQFSCYIHMLPQHAILARAFFLCKRHIFIHINTHTYTPTHRHTHISKWIEKQRHILSMTFSLIVTVLPNTLPALHSIRYVLYLVVVYTYTFIGECVLVQCLICHIWYTLWASSQHHNRVNVRTRVWNMFS